VDESDLGPLRTDRFELRRRLGAGSFGVVYEAYDRHLSATVALKKLYEFAPDTLLHFKREFRTLADVSHPNLVAMHELFGEDDEWFFTMELVPGTDFLSYVRPERLDPERLRAVLRQLVHGVVALHSAGKLHRDLKPMNVRVRPDGSVVLLDFGLVTEFARDQTRESSTVGIVGTPAYMAPEQAGEASLTEAADWYSVGAMLYEALTGRLPFVGTVLEVLLEKQMGEPAPPQELAPDVPPDLAALCVRLLRQSANARPAAAELLQAFGAVPERAGTAHWTADQAAAMPFVGRDTELACLHEAFATVRSGRAATVYITGESGMGKTALVRRFLSRIEPQHDTVVLTGRCYERESVPYKAMDPLVDTLTRVLTRLPRHEAAALMPRDAATLARLFPVLGEVEDIAEAPDRPALLDLQELRRRAFGAFRELLSRLADRRPVVLFIDDLQWGDADSGRMLFEILRPPDPPSLLLLTCYRTEDVPSSPLLRMLSDWRSSADQSLEAREVIVGPLPATHAADLARLLLETEHEGRDGPVDQDAATAIGQEAGGSPFFVSELVRHVRQRQDLDSPPDGETPSLGAVLRARLARLPDRARDLLEVVAVAGAPLDRMAALRAAALGADDLATLTLLRNQRLVRARPMNGDESVEPYHDRIRSTVVTTLAPERLRAHHHAIAQVLETVQPPEHEALAVHWMEAGESTLAADHAEIAAAMAADALAFDRAASWYRLAIDLRPPVAGVSAVLQAKLGEALANAGRGAEAAEAYFHAARDATPTSALEYRRRGTEELLKAGYIERGIAALGDLSSEVGKELGRSPRGAIALLVLRRARLRMRGLRFLPRAASQIAATDLARLDIMWTASVGLAIAHTIHVASLVARHLLLAFEVGDLHRVARALAMHVGFVAVIRSQRDRERIIAAAEALARQAESPHVVAILLLSKTVMAYHSGQFRLSITHANETESLLRERCTGVTWESHVAQIVSLRCLWHMGRVGELGSRGRALIEHADDLGNRWAATMMGSFVAWSAGLALSDDPDGAQRELDHAMRLWPTDRFYLPHFWAGHGGVQIALYAGNVPRASALLATEWRRLERSQYMRIRWVHILSLDIRARCAVAAAAAGGGERLLRQATRDASRLERIGVSAAHTLGLLVRAIVSSARGDRAGAVGRLQAAEVGFQAAEMELHAAVARRRRGELLGGEEGRALVAEANAWMTGQGVKNPARMSDALAPGFPG
jgi:eukaryotic-like serine/threonine-protein kinase